MLDTLILERTDTGSVILRSLGDERFEVEVEPDECPYDKRPRVNEIMKAAKESQHAVDSKTNSKDFIYSVTISKKEDVAMKVFAQLKEELLSQCPPALSLPCPCPPFHTSLLFVFARGVCGPSTPRRGGYVRVHDETGGFLTRKAVAEKILCLLRQERHPLLEC